MSKHDPTIRAVEISLTIIQRLVELDGARVTELADDLDIAPSTAHNHLQTLLANDYIINEGSVYYPSLEFLNISQYVQQRKTGYQKAQEHVDSLTDESGGRTHFTVLEHDYGRYVYTKTGDLAVETFSRKGSRFPLHVTAAGKAMLATIPESQVQEIIDRKDLKAYTENSVTSKRDLFEELEIIRDRGFAFNMEEHNEGINAVAAPVQESSGELLGALSISGPARRFKGSLLHEELPDLLLARVNGLELDVKYAE